MKKLRETLGNVLIVETREEKWQEEEPRISQ